MEYKILPLIKIQRIMIIYLNFLINTKHQKNTFAIKFKVKFLLMTIEN